jgi:CheY-like chemotaxis protein
LRILLVDDDDLIRTSTGVLLEQLGHAPVFASSGEEALAALEGGCALDAVILDMNMPGLGGAATLPRLRALRPGLPVLLATGRADQAALDLVAGFPSVTLMSKPFSLEELQERLLSVSGAPPEGA